MTENTLITTGGFATFQSGATSRTGSLQVVWDADLKLSNGTAGAGEAALLGSVNLVDGHIVIDAVSASGSGADLLPELEALGLVHSATAGAYVSGLLPIEVLPALDGLVMLRSAQASPTHFSVGLAENEAVQSLDVDDAVAQFGVDGTGVTVGLLSDSFDARSIPGADYAADIASGDLPADVLVLEDLPSGEGIDEGRAMAQLVHDIAPGADLQFHTAGLGIASFAQGILDLRAAGADIIVDDARYLAEPIFSDGVIAQAVDQVVEDGALYFSSAGNLGRLGYDSAFRNSGIGVDYLGGDGVIDGFAHDFDPDPDSTVTTQRITLAPSLVPENPTAFTMSFQWDDPFFSNTGGQAANDTEMDVIFRIANGADFGLPNGAIVGGSAANNLATGDPVEIAGIANPFDAELQIDVQLLFRDDPANNEPGRLVYQLFDNGTVTIDTFDTTSGTASGHAAARGAIATGASFFGFNSAADFEAFFGIPPEAVGTVVPAIDFFPAPGRRRSCSTPTVTGSMCRSCVTRRRSPRPTARRPRCPASRPSSGPRRRRRTPPAWPP